MKSLTLSLLSSMLLAGSGCVDNSPPPERIPVPAHSNADVPITRGVDEMKPLPPDRVSMNDAYAQPPFEDVPLVSQQMPEQPAFVDAYRKVGQPRIVLFVNRTLEGSIVPVNPNDPLVSVEQRHQSSGSVKIESNDSYTRERRYRDEVRERSDRFESSGPADYRKTTDVYLKPGQYDEVNAKSLDYEAIENIMTDFLACNGQVTVVSPIMARQRLSDQQVKELQEGRPQVMSEVAQQLNADILVQVQARPTKQTRQGLEVRIIAEALNTKGGESVSRAVVDVPPPLEKTTINRYTRFMTRKLMDGMLGFWSAPPPPPREAPPALNQHAPPARPPAEAVPPQPAPPPAPPADMTPPVGPAIPPSPPTQQP